MDAILIILHCESNTNYAIGTLEQRFFRMASTLTNGDHSRIHFGYPSMSRGRSGALPPDFDQYLIIDTRISEREAALKIQRYIERHRIDVVFGFDQPVHRPLYRYLRAGGVKHFISYWGAPISSVFGPVKRLLKKIDVALHPHGPDHYIFESQGMRETAVLGRGIASARTSVVRLGIDPQKFRPASRDRHHIHRVFGIPKKRRIFFYSGHMEPRKGIPVILRAAELLAQHRQADDWHIVLLGDQRDQAQQLLATVHCPIARDRITFGGYRQDVNLLHRGCYAGIIASTGWDSLTTSAIEMQASGLPLLLSDLPGLREAIDNQRSGVLFPVGDSAILADAMAALLDDCARRNALAAHARERVLAHFTADIQVENLVDILRRVCGDDDAHLRPTPSRATRFEAHPR